MKRAAQESLSAAVTAAMESHLLDLDDWPYEWEQVRDGAVQDWVRRLGRHGLDWSDEGLWRLEGPEPDRGTAPPRPQPADQGQVTGDSDDIEFEDQFIGTVQSNHAANAEKGTTMETNAANQDLDPAADRLFDELLGIVSSCVGLVDWEYAALGKYQAGSEGNILVRRIGMRLLPVLQRYQIEEPEDS